jgi:hypothetical protein
VDAYSNYILRTSDDRLNELRREAAEHAMSRAARRGKARWWMRTKARPATTPAPVRCPVCRTPLALTLDVEELVGTGA